MSVSDIARSILTPKRRAARASSVVWERAERVTARYGPIAVWEAGSGPAVLLVHGWETDHTEAGRRVVAFDLPAHGETPGDLSRLTDCASAVEDVAAFVGGVDGVIAHSAGCDIPEDAGMLDVPRPIVHSKGDRVCDPQDATEIAAAWKGARVEFVENLGHNRILRDPAVVERASAFVTSA